MEFSLEHLQPKERASFALRSLYETAGCRKYHMGRFEEYSLYQENRSFLSSEQVITFTDLDGRLLALKPDVTLSIAKTAQPAPGETLRYYYHENVYRPSAESHTFKEISQMGLELLGAVGEAEVQQAVCLAAQSLAALGAEWVLEVSHMGYLFGLFDALGVPEAARAQLLEKLRQKNAHELRAAALAAGLSETAADALCGVLELSGSYAATLSKAAALCRNPAMTAAVAELTALAPTLGQAGGSIRLDLTLAGEMEYYNGLVFQGYLKALPRPLLKGGRYDLLLQKFTPGAGAIGFAVYLDELDRLNAMPPVQHQDTGKVMLNVALPKGRLGSRWRRWAQSGCWKSATWATCSACSMRWACRKLPGRSCWKSCDRKMPTSCVPQRWQRGFLKRRQTLCAGCWNFPAATPLPFPRRQRSAATPP